jgi:hypothetical protein
MAAAWRDVLAAYDQLRTQAEGCHELDDETVLVLTRNQGRQADSPFPS